jgi:hypothetical protein
MEERIAAPDKCNQCIDVEAELKAIDVQTL